MGPEGFGGAGVVVGTEVLQEWTRPGVGAGTQGGYGNGASATEWPGRGPPRREEKGNESLYRQSRVQARRRLGDSSRPSGGGGFRGSRSGGNDNSGCGRTGKPGGSLRAHDGGHPARL